MKMNKEQFLKTEFGGELESTITAWDDALSRNREDKEVLRTLAWCQAQWEVYRMAIKHFYGVEYHFTRPDEYYGLCTEDESDWLMRVKRVKLFQMETAFSRQRVTRRGIRIDGVEYWDADFVHLNLGKTVIAECTPWFIRVYTEAGTPLHIFRKKITSCIFQYLLRFRGLLERGNQYVQIRFHQSDLVLLDGQQGLNCSDMTI